MKQCRLNVKFMTLLSSALILFVSCAKGKDNKNDLLLAAILLNGGTKAEFRISNINTLVAARTAANSSQSRIGESNASAFLTDLGGDNPQNYGDGAADGFNDHFITPAAISIGVCQVVAYKSVAKGGPAKGSETLENANFIMFELSGSNVVPGAKMCGSGFMPIGLQTGDSTLSSGFLPITPFPEAEKQDYDRVGIIARDFTYYFDPKDVPENSYRYVDLILNDPISNIESHRGYSEIIRGDVSPKLFNKNCPESFLNSPSYIYSDLLKSGEMENLSSGSCMMTELAIDANSGHILKAAVPDILNPFTDPGNVLNPPSVAGVAFASPTQKLKFKTPASINNLDIKDPYILVVDLDSSKKDGGSILFNVSIDKVLFWDSTSADNVFSPQLDAGDSPNATSGNDNLTNTARKNMIFHLPTIISNYK